MFEVSTQTLMRAISAMAIEQELTTRRIEQGSVEEDEEEHLSEHVLDLQKALSELVGIYEHQRQNEPIYPAVEDLIRGSIESVE